jgi:hypothetical protein
MQWPPSSIVKREEGSPRTGKTTRTSFSKMRTVAASSSSSSLCRVERTPPRPPRRSDRHQSRRRCTNSKGSARRSKNNPLLPSSSHRGRRQLLSHGQTSSSDAAGLPAVLLLLDRGGATAFSSRQNRWLAYGQSSRHNRSLLSLSPIPACQSENARAQTRCHRTG